MVNYLKYISFLLILSTFSLPGASATMTPKNLYLEADACRRSLMRQPAKMKYRVNWLRCINKYREVYKSDPDGSWAAAGLFRTGELYRELHRWSNLDADRQQALDIFSDIIKRYPRSAYRSRSAAEIRTLKEKQPPPASASSSAARVAFERAEDCHQQLKENPRKMKYRDQWLTCIDQYQAVAKTDPGGEWAAAALYQTAEMYRGLYHKSFRTADKKTALDLFGRVVTEYPASEYKAKARAAIRQFPGRPAAGEDAAPAAEKDPVGVPERSTKPGTADAIAGVINRSSGPDDAGAEAVSSAERFGKVTITGLRFWSNPNYTRVVIDATDETPYQHNLLKKDPSIQKPQRLYIDLDRAVLGRETTKVIPINDNLLSDVRAGQYTLESVRVVIDIKSFKTYKIFSLKNPFRIVIDVWGETERQVAAKPTAGPAPDRDEKPAPGSLAKQLALGVSRIVIDPGHGGKDYGAPGYLRGVHEKYIVLSIAKRLARKIKEQLGCEVIMTRARDEYLTLEERTAIANTKNADLFISIHTNSARDRRAYGLETYFLNLATDDEAILVAARENATSTKNISDLQTILNDLMHNAKVNESSRLAAYVQESLHQHMRSKYSRIKSKGVKQAPFYVLLGAQMPSILIETSFISNPRECERLKDPRYQDHLSEGIIKGIRQYIKDTNPTAIFKPSRKSNVAG